LEVDMGIHYESKPGLWYACDGHDEFGKPKLIGFFDTEAEAQTAYKQRKEAQHQTVEKVRE
jgi:hypothetical protein